MDYCNIYLRLSIPILTYWYQTVVFSKSRIVSFPCSIVLNVLCLRIWNPGLICLMDCYFITFVVWTREKISGVLRYSKIGKFVRVFYSVYMGRPYTFQSDLIWSLQYKVGQFCFPASCLWRVGPIFVFTLSRLYLCSFVIRSSSLLRVWLGKRNIKLFTHPWISGKLF